MASLILIILPRPISKGRQSHSGVPKAQDVDIRVHNMTGERSKAGGHDSGAGQGRVQAAGMRSREKVRSTLQRTWNLITWEELPSKHGCL